MWGKADTFVCILWNAKHFPEFKGDGYLVWYEYTDFRILIDPLFHCHLQVLANDRWVYFGQERIVTRPQWGNNGPDAHQCDE